MKKLLLTLLVSFALCGSIFAQYESHWPYQYHMENGSIICAAFAINGHVYTVDDEGWDALEVAFFVTNSSGQEEHRGGAFLDRENVDWYGDPYPITAGNTIDFTTPGEVAHFKLWDHINGVLYEQCEVTYQGEPIEIVTGEDHNEAYVIEPYDPIILNFTAGIPFVVNCYTEEEGRDNYYLISSPVGAVSPANVTNMVSDYEYDLYYFDQSGDEEGNEWFNYKQDAFGLEPGKGYLYANGGDGENPTVTLTFPTTGTYEGDGTFDLEYDENAIWKGWNLMGNPYNATVTVGREFMVINAETGEIVPSEGNTVEPMQGIFVQATGEGESITFTVGEKRKVSKLALNLLGNNSLVDRAIVNFGKGSLSKFQIHSNSTKLYIPVDGEDYAVASAEGMGEMPVNFRAEKSGSYTISAKGEEVSFTYLHLIDNMTGADVDLLATPSYSFNASTTDYAQRFRLVFATGDSMDGDTFGFVNGAGNLSIYGIEGEATLQVMDVNGRVLSTETFSGSYEKSLNVAAGIYMLRLTNGDNVRVQKMVVK